jgi:hypothetical protein
MFHNLRHVLHSLVLLLVVLGASTFVLGARIDILRLVVIYVGVTLTLAALTYLQKAAPRVREGWHYLTPSAMEWFGLAGCFALTAFLLWVYYFVGSARADVASQMVVLKILIVAFAAGTALIFYTSFASELRWNDHTIEQHHALRPSKAIKFSDIVDGGMNPLVQSIWIAASDGTTIQFSPYANGAETLARTIFAPGRKAPTR